MRFPIFVSILFFCFSTSLISSFQINQIFNCEYCDIFRLRTRTTGRFLSTSKDKYLILNLPDELETSYKQGDLFVQCNINGTKYVRYWSYYLGYLTGSSNNFVLLDEETAPGYVLLREKDSNMTLDYSNYTLGFNIYFTPLNASNINTHFNKVPVEFKDVNRSLFYEFYQTPKEFCAEEKRAFRFLHRMSGKVLYVNNENKLVLAYFDSNKEELNIVPGSDVWSMCFNEEKFLSILKNLANGGTYLNYNNITKDFYVSKKLSNMSAFVDGDDNKIFLGYYNIQIHLDSNIYYLASDLNNLKIETEIEKDLYADWNRQIIDL